MSMEEVSILIVDEYGVLKRMRVPIVARTLLRFWKYQRDQQVLLTRILSDKNGNLLYEVDGLLFPHSLFAISKL